MATVTEPNFRTVLELARETGPRVQGLRKIEARYHDRANHRIIFPPRDAKSQKDHRVISLGNDRASEIVASLSEQRPTSPILHDSDGNPWNQDLINCAFWCLKKKLGRKLHLGHGARDTQRRR